MADKVSVNYENGTTVSKKEKKTWLVADIARDVKKQCVDHGSAFAERVKENKLKYALKAGVIAGAGALGAFLLKRSSDEEPDATDEYYTYDDSSEEAPFESDGPSTTDEPES